MIQIYFLADQTARPILSISCLIFQKDKKEVGWEPSRLISFR